VEKISTLFIFSDINAPPPRESAVCEVMWKNFIEPDRQQMTIWRMRFACWITKAAHTLSLCNIHCLYTTTMVYDRASMLNYTYSACIVVR